MDIHKPKPWHGVREFLKEYAIIVVGVLTALGGEQVVENLHWQEKVRRAEEAEKPELQALYFAAYERNRTYPCREQRIDQLKAALLAAQGEWTPLPPMKILGRDVALATVSRGWRDQVWRSVVADGTASHLPSAREQLYADVMGQAEAIEVHNTDENAQNAQLNLLQNHVQLSPDMRAQLVEKLEQERARNWREAATARQFMLKVDKLVAHDPKAMQERLETASGTYEACYTSGLLPPGSPPHHEPAPEVARMLGGKF
jgi:hypothetical protein